MRIIIVNCTKCGREVQVSYTQKQGEPDFNPDTYVCKLCRTEKAIWDSTT